MSKRDVNGRYRKSKDQNKTKRTLLKIRVSRKPVPEVAASAPRALLFRPAFQMCIGRISKGGEERQ